MLPDLRRFPAGWLLAALLVTPVAAPLACEVPAAAPLDQYDADRMAGFSVARIRGLAQALLTEDAGERAIAAELFAGGDGMVERLGDGRYRCRTIKFGGLLPLVTYGFFDCAVSGNGAIIEKLTGSQRFRGDLLPAGGAMFYWGALHYGDEEPMAYGADEERNQAGCLYRIEGTPLRYRLELPFPRFESTHDVIELVPAP